MKEVVVLLLEATQLPGIWHVKGAGALKTGTFLRCWFPPVIPAKADSHVATISVDLFLTKFIGI